MYTIKTKSGKEFTADMVREMESMYRLYIHIVGSSAAKVAVAFTDPEEISIEGFEEYRYLSSMSVKKNGIEVWLRKEAI